MRQVLMTPGGLLELTCAVGGVRPTLVHTHGSATVLERWSSPHHLDIRVVRADIDPPFGQTYGPVDGYLAVVWTLDAHEPCGPIAIGAHFTDPTAREHLSGNNGEWLEAVDHDLDAGSLSIGTQDDEALLARARRDTSTRLGPPQGLGLRC